MLIREQAPEVEKAIKSLLRTNVRNYHAAVAAGDTEKAIAYWEALLPQVEPGSEIDRMLRGGIDKMKQGG